MARSTPLETHRDSGYWENAVTGTSFAEASAPSPPKTESAPVALGNEVPVTAFLQALKGRPE